jgi:hypothetical protein
MKTFKIVLNHLQVDYWDQLKTVVVILIVGAKNKTAAKEIVSKKYKIVNNLSKSETGSFQIVSSNIINECTAKSEFIEEVYSTGDPVLNKLPNRSY